MTDTHCETECKQDLIDRINANSRCSAKKLDRSMFWKIAGGFIGASLVIIGIVVTITTATHAEQEKRIEKVEDVQHEVVANQKLIQKDIEIIREKMAEEADRNEKTQAKILDKLEELQDFQHSIPRDKIYIEE